MNDQPYYEPYQPYFPIDNTMRLCETFSNPESARQYKTTYYNEVGENPPNSDDLNPQVNTSGPSLNHDIPNVMSLQAISSIPLAEYVEGRNSTIDQPKESDLGFVIRQHPFNPAEATIYVPAHYKKVVIVHENRVEDVTLKNKRDRVPFTELEKGCILSLYDRYKSLRDLTKKAIAEMIFRDVYVNPTRDETIIKIRESIKEKKGKKKERDVQSVLCLLYNNK